MISALIAVVALLGSEAAPGSATTTPHSPSVATQATKVDRFARRPQTRIAFAQEVRNFQVKRDGYDDILYLETRRDRWFRSEINCFGIADPRDAQGLLPLDHTSGFDTFSRVALVGFGHQSTECRLNGLVELTPDEAVELRLIRRRSPSSRAPNPAPAPAS